MGTPRPVSSVRRFAAAVLCLAFVALGVLAPLHALHHHPKAHAKPACACQHTHTASPSTASHTPPSPAHTPDDHEAACGLCQFLAGCAAPTVPAPPARAFTPAIPLHGTHSPFSPPAPTFLAAAERGPPRA